MIFQVIAFPSLKQSQNAPRLAIHSLSSHVSEIVNKVTGLVGISSNIVKLTAKGIEPSLRKLLSNFFRNGQRPNT